MKLARNTVREIVRAGVTTEATEHRYVRKDQPLPLLGAFVAALDAMLTSNLAKPKRERLTYQRIFEELRLAGYQGGYDNVRRYAKAWALREGAAAAVAYVPLSFAPGEAYQFDWSGGQDCDPIDSRGSCGGGDHCNRRAILGSARGHDLLGQQLLELPILLLQRLQTLSL